jgi:hypothetical protein
MHNIFYVPLHPAVHLVGSFSTVHWSADPIVTGK